jgi:hypothetical protein
LGEIDPGFVIRSEKSGSPEKSAEKKLGILKNEVWNDMIPSVTFIQIVVFNEWPNTQFLSGKYGRFSLATTSRKWFQDTLLETVDEDLVLNLFVVLKPGISIQFSQYCHLQEYEQYGQPDIPFCCARARVKDHQSVE